MTSGAVSNRDAVTDAGAAPATEFAADQMEAAYPEGVEHHWWSRARNRILDDALRSLARPADPILEIGCGTGVVVDHLMQRGWDITGCDLADASPATPEVAPRLHLGADAFELPEAVRTPVRGIMLLDVLEHLPEPADFVARLVEGFPHLSWLLVTVPARPELWSNYDEHYGHYTRYTRARAGELAPSGVRVEDARYFFHGLWLPARLLTLLKRDRDTVIQPPAPSARPLHKAVAAAFVAESKLVPGAVYGSSLRITLRVEGRGD